MASPLLKSQAMTKRALASRTIVSLGVLLAVGCGQEATGGAERPLAQGLTVLEADPGSLSVAFRRDDLVIYAEAVRGGATPEPYASDPASPRFQMDARFLSDEGATFFSQRGGDEWIDESWAEDREDQSSGPMQADSNRAWFELAGELARALPSALEAEVGAEGAAGLSHEVRVLVSIGSTAVGVYEEQLAYVQGTHEAGTPRIDGSSGGDVTYGTNGPEDAWWSTGHSGYYYLALYNADLDYAWLCGGYHSGTRLYEWLGSAWLSIHDNANHGRGPSESGMTQSCFFQYYEAVSDYHPAWTVTACGTGYDMLSNGGGHNCHDDARIQMNDLIYDNALGGSQYWCGDGDNSSDYSCGTEAGHPLCNSRGRSGYNHPSRCQYNYNSTSCPASYQGTNDGCDCGCVFPDGTGADPDCR